MLNNKCLAALAGLLGLVPTRFTASYSPVPARLHGLCASFKNTRCHAIAGMDDRAMPLYISIRQRAVSLPQHCQHAFLVGLCLQTAVNYLPTRSPMLGSMWAGTLSYSAVKLFSKYSNICDHGTWTSQTGRQTDGQTDRQTDDILWHNRALRSIAR